MNNFIKKIISFGIQSLIKITAKINKDQIMNN